MTRLKLVSTKISDDWVDRLEESTRLTGLTQSALVRKAIGQYLGLETVDHVDPYRSELDDIKARLTTLEKSTGLTMVDPTPPPPIAVVTTITSPPIEVVNTSPPIDSTDATWYTTSQAHELLKAKGYTKILQSFRRDLAPMCKARQLSGELLGYGLRADFEMKEAYGSISKINKALWLSFEP